MEESAALPRFETLLAQTERTNDPRQTTALDACRWLAQELGPEYREGSENIAWKLLDGITVTIVSIACSLYIAPSLDYWKPSVVLGVIFAAGGVTANAGPNIWSAVGITSGLRPSTAEEKAVLEAHRSTIRRTLYTMFRAAAGLSAAIPFTQVGIETLDHSIWYFVPAIVLITVGDWILKWFGLEELAASRRTAQTNIQWTENEKRQIALIRSRIAGMHEIARKTVMNSTLAERQTSLKHHYETHLTNKEIEELLNALAENSNIDNLFDENFSKENLCSVIAKLGLKKSILLYETFQKALQGKAAVLDLNKIINPDSVEEGNQLTLEEMRILTFLQQSDPTISASRDNKPGAELFKQLIDLIETEIGLRVYQEVLKVGAKDLPANYQGSPPTSWTQTLLGYGGGLFALAGLAGYNWKAKTASFHLSGEIYNWAAAPVFLAASVYWGGGAILTGLSWVALGWLVGKSGQQVTDLIYQLAMAAKEGKLQETMRQMLPIKLYPKTTLSVLTISMIMGSLSWATNALVNDEVFEFNETLRKIMLWIAIVIAVEFNTFAFIVGITAPSIVAFAKRFSRDEETKDLAQIIQKMDCFFKKFTHIPPENVLLILERIKDEELLRVISGNISTAEIQGLFNRANTGGLAVSTLSHEPSGGSSEGSPLLRQRRPIQ